MSESYTIVESGSANIWNKLYAYLLFRVLSEGIWIVKDPSFWFRTILDMSMKIGYTWRIDTGGYPNNFTITVETDQHRFDQEAGTRFSTSITYDELVYTAASSFAYRAMDIYRYMNNFVGPGKMMFTKLKNSQKFDVAAWNRAFGPLNKVGELSYEDLVLSELTNMTIQIRGFDLLADTYHIPKSDIRFTGKTGELVKICRKWALFAIMEMERFYHGTC